MLSSAVRKASELEPEVRRAVETLLGRPLDSDEHVSLNAFRLGPAASGKEYANASRRLAGRIDKTAKKAEAVSGAELDAAIDEAVDAVRHRSS
jgi:hypothetical protein